MEVILHAIGTCSDTHSHFDLLDLIFGGAIVSGTLATFKYYWIGITLMVKEKINKIRNNGR
jgi:hypothetical protein|tara:strand:+ start:1678 stop:1860 length:183 start_codon:yes stop_codon:yes gene_type:complete